MARVGHALPFERENLAALRACRDVQLLTAVERGHFDRCPQRRLRIADRCFAVEVLASTLEQRMLGHLDEAVAIAGRPAVGAWLALALQTQAGAIIDASRDIDLASDFLLDVARAAARATRILD